LTRVDVEAPDLCPRYTARVIRGVRVGPSPRWLVERLEAVGLRSVNNIVDVTNYVLMEYSQPLHSFDYDKLAENRIVVRRGRDGERIVSIDGTACALDSDMLVIADAERPVAIAGIMGGLDTEVGDETTNILLESALFDPLSVRRTSRRLGLLSESNYRFERGIDPLGVDAASLRACQLILDLAGGELAEGIVDVWREPWRPRTLDIRPERTSKLLGVDVPAEQQLDVLGRLGLSPRLEDGRIVCDIPSHRPDLTREADLIEEVARTVGYDKIPIDTKVAHPVVRLPRVERARQEAGRVMTAGGFDEARLPTFVDAAEAKLFGVESPVCVNPRTRKTNNALRPTLIPSLLRAVKTNQDVGNADVHLFELAGVFPPGETADDLPAEFVQLAAVSTGDLRRLRGVLEQAALRIARGAEIRARAAELPGYAPAAAAEILLDGEVIGSVGVVHPNVQDHYGLERTIAAGGLRFDDLVDRAGEPPRYEPVAKFPPVTRDLSLIVDEDVTWAQLAEVVGGVAQPMREACEYVTTYRGKPVPAGRKSVTLSLTYRSPGGTLRSEEVDERVARIVSAAQAKLAAELRT
jgi:phenylalanyl-tRNA synthetase beta chain